ncbi:MAG: hypothetical protein ABSG85_08460 [Spirochaetia bacterium]
MNQVVLDAREQEELYVFLKPLEKELVKPLDGLLRRIERALYERLTIEELEKLGSRFGGAH